jgi:hypothetical protein
MLQSDWLPLRSFSTSEKCVLIMMNGVENCGFNENTVQRLADSGADLWPIEK